MIFDVSSNLVVVENMTIRAETDLVYVRQHVKKYALQLKFSLISQTKLITAASEIGRNALVYGGGGQFMLEVVNHGLRQGLKLTFTDQGPGIADIAQAFQDGYTSSKGMGLGLGGAKRLVNEFVLESTVGQGTKVTLIQWAT